MYLNPYYVVANVIFYDEQRKYVHVERKVWNLIINKMKNSGPLEPKTISYFKRELYNLYITYLKSGKINVNLFNKVWCKVSNRTYRAVHEFQLIEETSSEEPVMLFDESLNSDTLERVYIEEENSLIPQMENLGLDANLISRQIDFMKTFRDNFDIYWNLKISMSKIADELFSFVSYNRLKSIFMTLANRGFVDLNSLVEFIVVSSSYDMLIDTIKVFPNKLNYICETCLTINKHKHKPKYRGDTDLLHNEMIRDEHKEKVFYFDNEEFYGIDLWLCDNREMKFRKEESIKFDFNSKISPKKYLKYLEENRKIEKRFQTIGTPGFVARNTSFSEIKTFVDSLPEVTSYYYEEGRKTYWNLDFMRNDKNVLSIENGVVTLNESNNNQIKEIANQNNENSPFKSFGSIFGSSSNTFLNSESNSSFNNSSFKPFGGFK